MERKVRAILPMGAVCVTILSTNEETSRNFARFWPFLRSFDLGFDELASDEVASPFNVYPVNLEVGGGVGRKLSLHLVYKCPGWRRCSSVGKRSS